MNCNGAGLCLYWPGWTARNDGVPYLISLRMNRSLRDYAQLETRPVYSESVSLREKNFLRQLSIYRDVFSNLHKRFRNYLIDVRVPRWPRRRRSGIFPFCFLCDLRTNFRRPFSLRPPIRLWRNKSIDKCTILLEGKLRKKFSLDSPKLTFRQGQFEISLGDEVEFGPRLSFMRLLRCRSHCTIVR